MTDRVHALLIEDNPVDARLIEGMLRTEAGDRVGLEWCDTLDAGVRRVLKGGVDVVLLDLSLPDSEGMESVSTVHLFDSVVPIVVLTGLEDDEAPLQAVREGAQDFLVKGRFDGRALLRAVLFAVERAGAGGWQEAGRRPDTLRAPKVRALLCPSGGRLVPQVADHLRTLQGDGLEVVYVCLDRPSAVLEEAYSGHGVDTAAVRFLDGERDLDVLWARLAAALGEAGPRAHLVVDSVNALLLQHSVDAAAEFVHFVANRLRLLHLGGDVLCHRNQEWSMIADRFTAFLDEEVEARPRGAATEPDPSVS